MVNLNKKATVISFPNEYRQDQFSSYLVNLGKKAKGKHEVRVQYAYLLKALDLMQYVDFTDLPNSADDPFYQELEIDVEGITYSQSFELIKPLDKENIFELRINLAQSNWRFRGIFFPYSYNGTNFYCFVFAFEKQPRVPFNFTDAFRDRAFNIYYDMQQNPTKYEHNFK